MNRPGSAAIVIGIAMLSAATRSGAESPPPAPTPPVPKIYLSPTESIEFVRCHFDEGRFVVRRGERLHVLRNGDRLESIGIRVIAMTPKSATLAVEGGEMDAGLRLVRILLTSGGAIDVREYFTDPEGLMTASGPVNAAPASIRRQAISDDPPRDR